MATEILNVAQMSDADRRAVQAGVSGIELMANAGNAVVQEILRRFPMGRVSVWCGPGNNGGDGFVVAQALAQLGWPVSVALLGDAKDLRGDARHHAQNWHGGTQPLSEYALDGATLIVDALFGSGLSRPLDATTAGLLASTAVRGIPLVAVDVPSGVMGDTGQAHGAVTARCTITFVRKKPAHVLLPGRDLCGDVIVADIGVSESIIDALHVETWENHPELWRHELPQLHGSGNKYSRGHALLVGGYPMTGAARMAARSAARAGAGLTTLAVPSVAFPIYAAALTSIMVKPLSDEKEFDQLLEDFRYTAFLIGPGAGADEKTRRQALSLLAAAKPTVLDADAITVFAGEPQQLFSALRAPCVLTPHEGEFKRIFACAGDKLTRARAAARLSGAIVVLKGSDTIVAAPDGRAIINANAPATLATAGSGDVLGGLIVGLLAQGMDAFLAAAAGVWIHGAAAAEFGAGLIAEDLPDLVPRVLQRLAQRPVTP